MNSDLTMRSSSTSRYLRHEIELRMTMDLLYVNSPGIAEGNAVEESDLAPSVLETSRAAPRRSRKQWPEECLEWNVRVDFWMTYPTSLCPKLLQPHSDKLYSEQERLQRVGSRQCDWRWIEAIKRYWTASFTGIDRDRKSHRDSSRSALAAGKDEDDLFFCNPCGGHVAHIYHGMHLLSNLDEYSSEAFANRTSDKY